MSKNLSKFLMFFSIVLILFISLNQTNAEEKPIDKEVIAIVNNENIYLKDYKRLLNAQGKKTINDQGLSKNIIDLLINKLIVLQEAKERDISISNEELNKAFNVTEQKYGSKEEFVKFLSANSATIEDARNEIKNQLLYEKTKDDITKGTSLNKEIAFKAFLEKKKIASSILIYNSKLEEETTNKSLDFSNELTDLIRKIEQRKVTKE